jgi:hypothetical protein
MLIEPEITRNHVMEKILATPCWYKSYVREKFQCTTTIGFCSAFVFTHEWPVIMELAQTVQESIEWVRYEECRQELCANRNSVETATCCILITMTQTFNRRWKEIGEDRKPLREDQKREDQREEDHLTKREDCRK